VGICPDVVYFLSAALQLSYPVCYFAFSVKNATMRNCCLVSVKGGNVWVRLVKILELACAHVF
jgi:hypothetical protein